MNKLNENNLQAPFQYRPSENTFILEKVSGEIFLSEDSKEVRVIEKEDLFCACIGYSIDGSLEEMDFFIDDIKVYPKYVDDIHNLREIETIKENEIYLIKDNIDFKSIIYFPIIFLNKKFNFTITTYNSVFTSYMFDEVSKKLNTLDINYPILNFKNNTNYKADDIIKYNGYLYKVNKDFESDNTDYHLTINTSLLTPFRQLENGIRYKVGDILEYKNSFFVVQTSFAYEESEDNITNISNLIKPLISIINWNDNLDNIYKNQIIIKDNISYIVKEDVNRPVWINLLEYKKIERLNTAKNTFFDDTNTNLDVDNIQEAIEKLNKKVVSSSSGVSSNNASNIYFDNSKTNLEYNTDKYIFPKFTVPENNIMNIVLVDSNYEEYTAIIIKNSEYKYIFSFDINNCNNKNLIFGILSLGDSQNQFKIFSKLSQFFEFNKMIRLSSNEILVDGVEVNANMFLDFSTLSLNIILDDDSILPSTNFSLSINIVNRHLKKEDTNIFYVSSDEVSTSNFELVEENGLVRLKGFYKAMAEMSLDYFGFCSPIIKNYFNPVDSAIDFITTLEITSNTLKEVKYGIIEEDLGDGENTKFYLFYFSYTDGSSVSIGDEFTFNLLAEKNYKLENIKKSVDNVQELGEVLSNRLMLPSYYTQYAKTDGTFDDNEAPNNWYKKMYGIDTTWELMFNTESVYFRTEGDLSNIDRINGLQGDTGRELTGNISYKASRWYGISGAAYLDREDSGWGAMNGGSGDSSNIMIKSSRQWPTSNEFRTKNRIIRVYHLVSINGVNISYIIGSNDVN